MNYTRKRMTTGSLIVAAAVSVILASCASTPQAPAGSAELRSKLTVLQSDASLAKQIPVALADADTAVKLAETPEADKDLAAHRLYMADRKIETARALAQVRSAEEQRAVLKEQNDSARLQARTREADAAHALAAIARADADASAASSANSRQQVEELQRQVVTMQATITDRGIVLTLGDVLFATGQSDLQAGAAGNLDRLATFLGKYPDRTASIEGHTDNVGAEAFNQALSLRRADAVRSYLVNHGVTASRLTTLGKGQYSPLAGNESAAGRQQNRRVEVVISNPPEASAAAR